MTENDRFTDDLRPELVAEAPGYSSKPSGTVRRAPLRADGTLLGWVWTNDVDAAGWTPEDPTPEVARAGAYAWRVAHLAYRRGEPAAVVLDPRFYEPLYQLGDPVT